MMSWILYTMSPPFFCIVVAVIQKGVVLKSREMASQTTREKKSHAACSMCKSGAKPHQPRTVI